MSVRILAYKRFFAQDRSTLKAERVILRVEVSYPIVWIFHDKEPLEKEEIILKDSLKFTNLVFRFEFVGFCNDLSTGCVIGKAIGWRDSGLHQLVDVHLFRFFVWMIEQLGHLIVEWLVFARDNIESLPSF